MLKVDLNKLANGALAERLGHELLQVAANIADPNTKPDAARSVTVEIKFKPDETRQVTPSEIIVKSKLAPAKGIATQFIIDQNSDGTPAIAELKSGKKGQMMIDEEGDLATDKGEKVESDKSKVVSMYN